MLKTECLKPAQPSVSKDLILATRLDFSKPKEDLKPWGKSENHVLKQCELNDETSIVSGVK